MPNIMDKMNYATIVTKWRADQQVRIMRAKGDISKVESQISMQKAALADSTLRHYLDKGLAEEDLSKICEDISKNHTLIQSINQTIEAIKNEQPPADPSLYSPDIVQYEQPPVPGQDTIVEPSGLVCPECGMPLVGRFCQIHGKEGIKPQ